MIDQTEIVIAKYSYQFTSKSDICTPGGWSSMLAQMCGRIDLMLDDNQKRYFFWAQIKSKFGGMRAHYFFSAAVDEGLGEDEIEQIDPGIRDFICRYEYLSFYICENCGQAGKPRVISRWNIALCDNCYEK